MLTITLETDSAGDDEVTSSAIKGTIHQIVLDIDALAAGADIDIVGATTGMVLYDKDNDNTNATVPLSLQSEDNTGTVIAADYRKVYINEPIKVNIAQGGEGNAATIYVIYS